MLRHEATRRGLPLTVSGEGRRLVSVFLKGKMYFANDVDSLWKEFSVRITGQRC